MSAGDKRFVVMNSNDISICGFATKEEAQHEANEMFVYHNEQFHVTEMIVIEWEGKLTMVAA